MAQRLRGAHTASLTNRQLKSCNPAQAKYPLTARSFTRMVWLEKMRKPYLCMNRTLRLPIHLHSCRIAGQENDSTLSLRVCRLRVLQAPRRRRISDSAPLLPSRQVLSTDSEPGICPTFLGPENVDHRHHSLPSLEVTSPRTKCRKRPRHWAYHRLNQDKVASCGM